MNGIVHHQRNVMIFSLIFRTPPKFISPMHCDLNRISTCTLRLIFIIIIIYKMEYWCLVYSKTILSCINIVFQYSDILLKINNVFSYCNKSCVYLVQFFNHSSRNLEFLMNENLIKLALPIFYISILWYSCLWNEGHA